MRISCQILAYRRRGRKLIRLGILPPSARRFFDGAPAHAYAPGQVRRRASSPASRFATRGKKVSTKTHCPTADIGDIVKPIEEWGNSRMRSQLSCSLAVLLVLAGEANAAPLPSAGVFTYSDQCFSRGSGDLYGLRITLLRGLGGNIWAVTYVEDEAPFLAFANYDAKTGAVRFDVANEGEPTWHIEGVADTNVLRGTRDGAPITLPAISNSETKTPYCGEK